MITLRMSKRVARGWETVTTTTNDVEQVKALRRAGQERHASLKAAGKDLFKTMKIGETIYQSASGNMTELAAIGICVACLGRGCAHCNNTGNA